MGENLLSPELQEQLDMFLMAPYHWQSHPPYALSGMGLLVALLCGLTFARQIGRRLEDWKQDRLPLLPLERPTTVIPYGGIVVGTVLFIGAGLQVFGFGAGSSFFLALLLAVVTGAGLWQQLEDLMRQVEKGTFAAADFDFFDTRR
ncbi:MAG: hypothetical protein F4Z75_10015 [Synechococcus sp. SB0668_bin_15]|nr:hypothetical protein [Synechococcus sp. SB0668_bin_15]MXZ83849.1 hypothetical protein [Synechococcus sp. SB0666_bin_14]MYA91317.1 hypothetical protein [Synechococcus sp. SB0663_bin_10]MYC50438.1 hypothetical protein [Synechococcus sp. SB0662_bin_14]MYG46516.1 hypothetical protein [Synechococcus sp. SB0675_bin_6]MYJ59937.1 hypothetical protein [Synechococcus sp. SB0672_bin_6]MYK91119.1 hypothetical protein [Synechococcus sp. SB0669_bin_8]